MSSIPSDALSDRGESQGSSQVMMIAPPTPPDMKFISIKNSKVSYDSFSDINIYVGPDMDLIQCHRFVLAKNSQVLSAMISDRWNHNDSNGQPYFELHLPADDSEAFRILVEFMYTDELKNDVSSSTLINLLDLCKKYDFPKLLIKVTERLSNSITIDNALSVYFAAKVYDLDPLKRRAFDVIRVDTHKVIATDEFLELNYEDLCELLASDELRVSETELLKAVCRWSEEACIINSVDVTSENCRLLLKDALCLIRYNEMTPEQFIEIAEEKDVFEISEKYDILHHLSNFSYEPTAKRPRRFEFNKNPRHCLVETLDAKGLFLFKKKTPELYNNGLATTFLQVNKPIKLHTIGIFMPKRSYGMGSTGRGRTYLTLNIKQVFPDTLSSTKSDPEQNKILAMIVQPVKFDSSAPTYYKFKLNNTMSMIPDVSYEISFKISAADSTVFTDTTILEQKHFRVRCMTTDLLFTFRIPVKIDKANTIAAALTPQLQERHFQLPQLSFVLGK